jgi:hypothetical protein
MLVQYGWREVLAELRIATELTPYEILYFGPLAAKEGIEGVTRELRRVIL